MVDDQFTFEAKELRASAGLSGRAQLLKHCCCHASAACPWPGRIAQQVTRPMPLPQVLQVTFVAGDDVWGLKFGSPGAFERFLQKFNKAGGRGAGAGQCCGAEGTG